MKTKVTLFLWSGFVLSLLAAALFWMAPAPMAAKALAVMLGLVLLGEGSIKIIKGRKK